MPPSPRTMRSRSAPSVDRRAAREPLQHITGRAPFRSLELAVGPGVFVPRPETELVAQLAIDALQAVPTATPRAADLGTGSGAIALALATEVPHARGRRGRELAGGVHLGTPERARRSGRQHPAGLRGPGRHCRRELDGTLDVVVSNPPYIPLGAVPRDPEVRLFDPEPALYGGADGFDVVRVISRRAAELLRPGGTARARARRVPGTAIARAARRRRLDRRRRPIAT